MFFHKNVSISKKIKIEKIVPTTTTTTTTPTTTTLTAPWSRLRRRQKGSNKWGKWRAKEWAQKQGKKGGQKSMPKNKGKKEDKRDRRSFSLGTGVVYSWVLFLLFGGIVAVFNGNWRSL